jgi:carbon-monoxide dehydrogenase medium subunit
VELADPLDDVRGSADYRRQLIPGLVARAVRSLQAQLKEGR